MKFLVALTFVIALQSVLAERFTSGESSRRTRCSYFADRLSLSCRGPSGVTVECQALSNFPIQFKILGLGLDPLYTGVNQFRIFPLRQDNSAWINHQFLVQSGEKISLSVHSASQPDIDTGISVRDSECFNRLISVFRESESNLVVPLSKLTSSNTVVPQASLFGSIILFEKSFPTIPQSPARF